MTVMEMFRQQSVGRSLIQTDLMEQTFTLPTSRCDLQIIAIVPDNSHANLIWVSSTQWKENKNDVARVELPVRKN